MSCRQFKFFSTGVWGAFIQFSSRLLKLIWMLGEHNRSLRAACLVVIIVRNRHTESHDTEGLLAFQCWNWCGLRLLWDCSYSMELYHVILLSWNWFRIQNYIYVSNNKHSWITIIFHNFFLNSWPGLYVAANCTHRTNCKPTLQQLCLLV
jgi:hypothetical protein